MPRLDLRGEHLVLEVSGRHADFLREADDFLRFGDVAGERFLASDAEELTPSAFDGVGDLLEVLDAGLIRAGDPDGVDVRVGNHVADRRIGLRLSDVDLARIRGGDRRVLLVRAPDAEDVAVANAFHAEHVELGVEAGADEAYP
jgi:hypothetical protein